MKRRSIVVTFLLLAFVITAWIFVRHRSDNAQRAQREHIYEARLAYYSKLLPPGMTREAVDNYLHNHGVLYRSRTIGPLTDDLIGIAREPSLVMYCSWLDVSVQIEYLSASDGSSEPQPEDRIRNVKLDRQLQNCL